MVHPRNIRLYQEPNTQIPDQIAVSGNGWASGYVYGIFDHRHLKMSAPYRDWTKFPVNGPPETDKFGDLQMHSDMNETAWALNENDEVRLGESLHKDIVISDDKMTIIWEEVLDDLVPIGEYLLKLGISSF